ncbi:transcriptional regulator [Kitasatospora griseola]|uniref:transcriptional regulator n=1 Tax=Kitasatospora griseola TaxID=2064 RepID=UPI00342FFB14
MTASVQSRLNDLFEAHPHPSGRPYTNEEISRKTFEWASRTGGEGVSASLIQKLRAGSKDNPTSKTLWSLAAGGFNVRPSYLMGDDEPTTAPAQATPATVEDVAKFIEDADVRNLALRANGLSKETLLTLTSLVERARALEGLDEDTPSN